MLRRLQYIWCVLYMLTIAMHGLIHMSYVLYFAWKKVLSMVLFIIKWTVTSSQTVEHPLPIWVMIASSPGIDHRARIRSGLKIVTRITWCKFGYKALSTRRNRYFDFPLYSSHFRSFCRLLVDRRLLTEIHYRFPWKWLLFFGWWFFQASMYA